MTVLLRTYKTLINIINLNIHGTIIRTMVHKLTVNSHRVAHEIGIA